MGRPLNKRYFGQPTGDNNKLTVEMWGGSGVVTGWIVKQFATGGFIVTDGTITDRARLQDETPTDFGQARIVVDVFDNGDEHASNVKAHLVRTIEENTHDWSLDPADEKGKADLPLA